MPHAEEEHCALNPEQPILTAMVTSANHCDIRLPTLTWRHLPHYHITKLISHPVLGDRECLLFRLTTIPEDFLCWNCKFITTQVQQILSKNINILFLCEVILATFFHSMASANWLFLVTAPTFHIHGVGQNLNIQTGRLQSRKMLLYTGPLQTVLATKDICK